MDVIFLYIKLSIGWFLLFISLFGWGNVVSFSIGKLFKRNIFSTWDKYWIGFVFLIFLLQIIHLFFPMNKFVSIIIILFGALLSIIFLLTNNRVVNRAVNWIKKNYLFVLCLIFLVSLVANQTFSSNLLYDFGLYYQQTIKWIQNSELIPGLANIHGRFGYNNASFLVASLYDGIELIPQSFRILSSGMIISTLVYSGLKIWDLIVKRNITYFNIYWSFALVLLLSLTFYNEGVNLISVSPDIFVSLFELVIIGILVDMVENKERISERFLLLMLLVGGLFCIKLSAAVFVLFSLLVGIFILLKAGELAKMFKSRALWIVTIIAGICVLVWILRSILLTGFTFYPFAKFGINVNWNVGVEQAMIESNWITSWARIPHMNPSEVLGNNEWIMPWIERNKGIMSFSFPLVLGVLLSFPALVSSKLKNRFLPLLVVPVSSLFFWFFTAPDVRFTSAVTWVFFVLSFLLFTDTIKKEKVSLFLLFFISCIFMAVNTTGFNYVQMTNIENNLINKEVELSCYPIDQRTRICKPREGDQCWYSTEICVPNINTEIKMKYDKNGNIRMIYKTDGL